MSLKNLYTLLKLIFLLVLGFSGLILMLSSTPETEPLTIYYLTTKLVAIVLLFICYKYFPFQLILEEVNYFIIIIAILACFITITTFYTITYLISNYGQNI